MRTWRGEAYHRGTYRSVKIETKADLSHLIGSVLWICKSPYRPSHGRKNWFLDVACCPTAETTAFDAEQIQFVPLRSRVQTVQNIDIAALHARMKAGGSIVL